MGAVLFSRNDLSLVDPKAAARVEEAVARAVVRPQGAFRVSVERALGESDVIVRIEAHRPGDAPWRRELRLSTSLEVPQMQERLAALMRNP